MMARSSSASLARFEAVYTSGFLIQNGALVTAMTLLFEQVHLANHLEYVIEFAKQFRIALPNDQFALFDRMDVNIERNRDSSASREEGPSDDDPFANLSPTERKTAILYLKLASRFCFAYSPLFPSVLKSDLFVSGDPLAVKLIEERMPHAPNKYEVSLATMSVSLGNTNQVDELVRRGVVPVVGRETTRGRQQRAASKYSGRQAAALLAMNSVAVLFPGVRSAHPHAILDAREKLRDYLPPFWASMLQMAPHVKERIANCQTETEVVAECQEIVDTIVRPAAIDLSEKLRRDSKNLFSRILSATSRSLRLSMGAPPVTTAQLAMASLSLGANIAADLSDERMKATAGSQSAGLTYLIELDKEFRTVRPRIRTKA